MSPLQAEEQKHYWSKKPPLELNELNKDVMSLPPDQNKFDQFLNERLH